MLSLQRLRTAASEVILRFQVIIAQTLVFLSVLSCFVVPSSSSDKLSEDSVKQSVKNQTCSAQL